MHKLGCKFAIDDFGSGFTSFKQLLDLPIDIVKIDGSYIRNILNNEQHKIFVKSLIDLAKNLNITAVAEFVESDEITDFLKSLEVTAMQGDFLLAASHSLVY